MTNTEKDTDFWSLQPPRTLHLLISHKEQGFISVLSSPERQTHLGCRVCLQRCWKHSAHCLSASTVRGYAVWKLPCCEIIWAGDCVFAVLLWLIILHNRASDHFTITKCIISNVILRSWPCNIRSLRGGFVICCPLFPQSTQDQQLLKTWCISENTGALFMEAISALSALTFPSVNELLHYFNCKIENAISVTAPASLKSLSGKQNAPWRNDESIMILKRKCEKAEHKWRQTKLQIHVNSSEVKLNICNLELRSIRQSFFSSIISNSINNAHTHFSTTDRLTNPPMPIASELFSTEKYKSADLFSNKSKGAREPWFICDYQLQTNMKPVLSY